MTQEATERLSTKQAAEHLGCSESWLNHARLNGRGPRYIRRGNRVWYRKSDLNAYDESQVVETADSRRLAAQAAG